MITRTETVAEVVLELPFSRVMELEADRIGLKLAAAACYDVREGPVVMEKMQLIGTEP